MEGGVSECPVCKAGVTTANVIPLYGRGQEPQDPRRRRAGASESTPSRPRAERPEPPRAERGMGGMGGGMSQLLGGAQFSFGLFPFGVGITFGAGPSFAPLGPAAQRDLFGQLTPEERRTQMMSTMVMAIGGLILFYILFIG